MGVNDVTDSSSHREDKLKSVETFSEESKLNRIQPAEPRRSLTTKPLINVAFLASGHVFHEVSLRSSVRCLNHASSNPDLQLLPL